ncbi:MAG: APC family permease [Acidobacteriota bacterium]
MDNGRPAEAEPTLVRALGVRAVAANIVNSTIGSGIFVLPAAVAAILGSSAILAYAICLAVTALVALCYAELGSRVDAPGGSYAYIEKAFGPCAGYVANVMMWLGTHVFSGGAVAAIFVASIAEMVPALGSPGARAAMLIAMFGGFALVNVRGVSSGNRLVETLTAAKLAPIVLLVVAGAWAVHPANLLWDHAPTFADLGRASLLLFFAFTGIENAMTLSGELRDPEVTVPRGILVGLGTVAALYAGSHLVAQGILGPGLSLEKAAPLAATAGHAFGGWARTLLLVTASVSTFGCISGDILAAPRLLYAVARDGLAPRRLGAVHPRYRTPHVAIWTHSALCCGFALIGSFQSLAILSASITLLSYLACALAAIALRRRDVRLTHRPFLAPGGYVVHVLACVMTGTLLASTTGPEVRDVAILIVCAYGMYVVSSATNRRRRVVPS